MAECEYEVDFVRQLTEVEQRCKSNTHRLDKLEAITEAVHELATAMKLMAEKQAQTAKTVDQLNEKVTALEAQPGKRWNILVERVILTMVAAIVGFVLARLGIS